MEKEEWSKIETYINNVLINVSNSIDNESKKSIQHYVSHDELEMAFEILFTEIMKINLYAKINFQEPQIIGKQLKLDEESVFNPSFWDEFISFIKSQVEN